MVSSIHSELYVSCLNLIETRGTKIIAPMKGDSKKKPAQPKKNDNHARQNVTVQEGATGDKCVARPVMTRAQRKMIKSTH